MAMLHELHTCNNCKGHFGTRYHCTVCDDFDLCIQCYKKYGHPHKMDRLGLDLDDGSSPSENKANPEEAKKLYIQTCIQSLLHASHCRDANCRPPRCQKMKRVVTHTKICKRKTYGGCPICKQLIALCCYHAKPCQETKCPVPFCYNIKQKMKHLRLQQKMGVMKTASTRQPANAVTGDNVPAVTPGRQSVVNPGAGIPGQAILAPQVQRGMDRLETGQDGNLLPMEQWQQAYPDGADQGFRQPGPQLMQQQMQLGVVCKVVLLPLDQEIP